jgi:hypothetical protein
VKKVALFLLILSFLSSKTFCFSLNAMAKKYLQTGVAFPSADEFMQILNACTERFKQEAKQTPYAQKLVVPSGSKISFMGDIHGSFESEFNNFSKMIQLGFLSNDLKIIDSRFKMIFLGDYVDRCPAGIEVLYTLASLKWQNWEKVILLRGNHETKSQNFAFGFLDEIRRKYYPEEKDLNIVFDSSVFNCVKDFFKWLPLVLFFGSGKDPKNCGAPFWIQCCHGGFECEIEGKIVGEEIGKFFKSKCNFWSLKGLFEDNKINDELCGFLWTDFCSHEDETICFIVNDTRGDQGFMINQATMRYFCREYGIKAVFRGHQHSFFGLKIGGCDPCLENCHWINFENYRLLSDVQKNKDGFAIYDILFPVFTFSTAAQAGVSMPYNCFGILTTANDYKDWRLKPYEYLYDQQEKAPIEIKKRKLSCKDIVLRFVALPFRIGYFCCKKCYCCCCCCSDRNHKRDDEDYITVD